MAFQREPDEDDGAGVDVSTLAAMSEYSSTAGGTQRSEPTVLLPPSGDQPMSHFDSPDMVRDELWWYALEQATQDPHPPESDLPPAEVAALHMVSEESDALGYTDVDADADEGRRPRSDDVRVSAIMTRDVQSIAANTPLTEVRECFATLDLQQLPVTDGDRLVGLISSNDLLQLRLEPLRRSRRNQRLQARHLMQSAPLTVREDDSVRRAAQTLCDGALNALPVVDADQHLVGMVTSTDLIRVLASR
jgi:CBS domain-containing membrane protein